MTQTLETLARRIESMEGIRSVVHTMKTLSVINATPYAHAARAIRDYHGTIVSGLHALLTRSAPLASSGGNPAVSVVVVFGSDHGLCGNYNEALAEHVKDWIAAHGARSMHILCVGAQMADALAGQDMEPDEVFLPPASVDGIGRLSNLLTSELDGIRDRSRPGEISVVLAYFASGEHRARRAELLPLLPLDREFLRGLQEKPWVSRSLPQPLMPADTLFTALVRAHLFASLFEAAAQAMVSENAARLALMEQAERAVDERLEQLRAETNSRRQDEITDELLDVIIGFEALKGRRGRRGPSRGT